MLKRVRGLVVAGLLVVGMSGNVFADNTGSTCVLPSNGEHKHETKEHIISYDEAINDDEVTRLKDQINKTSEYYIAEETTGAEDDVRVIEVYFDGNHDGDHTDEFDKLIETIKIDVNDEVGAAVEKGWTDILIPETGDAIALGGLAVAGVAAGALALNNKKKNK